LFQDQATQIILTLGQAFEVAYQMALRDQFPNCGKPGHTRSYSEHQIKAAKSGSLCPEVQANSHTRSHSVNGVVLPDELVPSAANVRPPIVFTEDM
jgi:hypothetical protein